MQYRAVMGVSSLPVVGAKMAFSVPFFTITKSGYLKVNIRLLRMFAEIVQTACGIVRYFKLGAYSKSNSHVSKE